MPTTTPYDYLLLALLSAMFVGLPVNWAMRDPALRRERLAYVIVMWALPFLAISSRGGPFWLIMILLYRPLLRLVGAAPRREDPRGRTLLRRLMGKDPRSRILAILVSLIVLIIALPIAVGNIASNGGDISFEQSGYVLGLRLMVAWLLWLPLLVGLLLLHPILAFVVGYVLPAGLLCAPWVLHKGVGGRRRTLTWCWLILSPLALYRSAQIGFHWALVSSPLFPGTSVEEPLDSLMHRPSQVHKKWELRCETWEECEELWWDLTSYGDLTTVYVVRPDRYFTTVGEDWPDTTCFWAAYLFGIIPTYARPAPAVGPLTYEGTTLDCIPR